jgi:thiol-disulfide isomerase/thioredoxin
MNNLTYLIIGIVAVFFVSGCINGSVVSDNVGAGDSGTGGTDGGLDNNGDTGTPGSNTREIRTFRSVENEMCEEDGKPLILLISTTWCPHCTWIKSTYDETVKKYVSEGKIAAYHWELDTGDNTLTEETGESVPELHYSIYQAFNPQGTIPTYVFGCKYFRVGNGFESQGDLNAEKEEFIAVIEKLLEE